MNSRSTVSNHSNFLSFQTNFVFVWPFSSMPWFPYSGFYHINAQSDSVGCQRPLIVKLLPWKVFWPLNSGIIGLWSPPMQLISQLHSTTDSFLFSFAVNSHFEVSSFQNAFVISVLNLVLFVNLFTVSHLELYHYIATNSETRSKQKR